MPKRIDQLDNRVPLNDDWVVSTITNGVAGRSRLYQLVRNGLDQSVDTGGNSLHIVGPERTAGGSSGSAGSSKRGAPSAVTMRSSSHTPPGRGAPCAGSSGCPGADATRSLPRRG